jgi:dihydrofolate synthase/folylpolyglutamate synthase
MEVMLYSEAVAWLYATQERGIKLGLDRMRSLLAALGWEQGPMRFLHVAGTNGKGSVCAMLDSVCRAAGIRTGLFTSPHLVTFRERIRLNGEMATKEAIASHLTRLRAICESSTIQPTFFEITTALAFELFRDAGVDLAILETGLGGRLDSTNVVHPLVSVITSIGLDHTLILGETLAEIAREKAGIIKPGVPVVTGPLPKEAAAVIAAVAAERGAPLVTVTEPLAGFPVSLRGAHQQINAAIAARALNAAGLDISPEQLSEGFRTVAWPGRFQETARGFILDGAHNPDAARRLAETWTKTYGTKQTRVILGIVREKDAPGICAALAPIASEFIITPVRSPRAGSIEDLHQIAAALRPTRACNSLTEAIATITPGETPVLITGSLFLIGEALVCLGLALEEHEISAQ